MATGYLQSYQSMLQVRHQVISVLTSDWTVLCFDHELKLLWKNKLTDKNDISVRYIQAVCYFFILFVFLSSEAAMLVVPVGIQQGDGGVVIVGGREVTSHQGAQESVKR